MLSIIVPFKDESGNLKELEERLKKINPSEIIFVNDHSTDGGDNIIEHIENEGYGKTEAIRTGLKNAKGDTVALIDSDLEDQPEYIPVMVGVLKDYDLVIGWRQERKLCLESKIYNWLIRLLFGLKIHDNNCGLKVMNRKVADMLLQEMGVGDMHRFIPVLAYKKHFRVGEVPVIRGKRKYGKSKYNQSRILNGMIDLINVWCLA